LADKDKKKSRTGSKPARGGSAKNKAETTRSKAVDSLEKPSPARKPGDKAKSAAARKKARETKANIPPPEPTGAPAAALPGAPALKPLPGWKVDPGIQRMAGLALIAASLILVASAGAWLGPFPASGALHWILKGLAQGAYVALMALSVWMFLRRRYEISYLLPFGILCAGVAVWDTGSGIYGNRIRLEANDIVINFRDSPLNASGLTAATERNPYVEAYMIMRDTHWELRNRLDTRMTGYEARYRTYVEKGEFLSVDRLRSRFELWRAFYQVGDLEDQLAITESSPVDVEDLLWTVKLLDIDEETRSAYFEDLRGAVAAANESQAILIARERGTLARIRQSLQVLIDARGRYRFAEGKVVFDDPEDAALFTGKEPPKD